MKLFFRFARSRLHRGGRMLLYIALFALLFGLYHIPLRAVLYPALLSAFAGLCFLLRDYIRFREAELQLKKIAGLSQQMLATLPRAEGPLEEDYQRILTNFADESRKLVSRMDGRYQEMIDYYTVWAHQIKTPIASMRLLLEGEDTPLSRRLTRELSRIEQYVEMVMAFLRLDSVSTDYVFQEQDLDRILQQVIRRYAAEFIDRKLALTYEPVHYTLVTDEKWLAFVLEQLLSNALKYTYEGGIRIYMSGPDMLTIEDTGIGIAPEDLPRIFEKGYTGQIGRTDKKASGIGLYLCKRVTNNLGLSLGVDSEPDKGTRAHLDLRQYHLTKA